LWLPLESFLALLVLVQEVDGITLRASQLGLQVVPENLLEHAPALNVSDAPASIVQLAHVS
jgi:hypothetical protein